VLIAHRLAQTVITFLLLTAIIFSLARLTGDPTPLVLPSEATEADRAFFRQQYGLDRSLPEQYFVFLSNVLRGDFGSSFRYREPAIDIVLAALGPTAELAVSAMILSILVGVPLGILGAVHRNTWIESAISSFSSMGQALPVFWVGLMLIALLSIRWPLFPSSGYGTLSNYVLPTLTLTLFSASSIARLTLANMRTVLTSDFVVMERVLGISEARIVLKHGLRNASLPLITFLGLQFGLLLGGAVVTERVFAWPGIGQVIVQAVLTRDYPVVQATVLCIGLMLMVINLAVDLLYIALDPRLRR
jgi:peptide/nickel transport system permease protein